MADATIKKKRPVYLDLFAIRLPVPGFVSILHRVSGVLLFIGLVFLGVGWFADSLASPVEFEAVKQTMSTPLVKLILLVLLWSFLHHLCAGIRFLLLDLHIGVTLPQTRAASWTVLAVSLALTAYVGSKLLW